MTVNVLHQDDFETVLDQHEIVILDFWSKSCGPCKAFAKVFHEVSEQHHDVYFAAIDVESETELADVFAVRSVPMVIILREGVVVFSESGTLPASALDDLIAQAKSLDMEKLKAELGAE